jgi:hypothetical protein
VTTRPLAFAMLSAIVLGACGAEPAAPPSTDAASPAVQPAPPEASPTQAPTPSPTPEPTPVPVAKPSGVRFDATDEGTCPSDPQATCSIDERVVTVSWKAPRTEGVEIRVYGVTTCFGTDADGAVIDGACLREHTRLPSSALVLLGNAPASQGSATVYLQPSGRGLADTQRGEKVYSVVLGAFNDAGDESVLAIAATQDYCDATKAPCDSRDGVTMTGEAAQGNRAGRLLIRVSMAGLAPGDSVTLKAAARYQVDWTCGEAPCPRGGLCGPAASDETLGTARATASGVAGADGTASARLRLVAPPPAATCPADPAAPWLGGGERWTRIKVTDPAHRLRLGPDPVEAVVY